MHNFIIYVNPLYIEKYDIFTPLRNIDSSNQVALFAEEDQIEYMPDFVHPLSEVGNSKIDCILVFGGDGTVLQAKQVSLQYKVPILGINIGSLGFLSEASPDELQHSMQELIDGKYLIEPRMLLQVIVKRANIAVYNNLALNDVVIYKGATPKLIDIRVKSNRRHVYDARCDGFVAATPTGSTAYALSGGGPILSPVMEAMVIVPLNPHVLTLRPMVFPAQDTLSFKIIKVEAHAVLQLDGINGIELEVGDEVFVKAASEKIEFIKLNNRTFYQILRKKMHLGKLGSRPRR